jgi:hypothetical protein
MSFYVTRLSRNMARYHIQPRSSLHEVMCVHDVSGISSVREPALPFPPFRPLANVVPVAVSVFARRVVQFADICSLSPSLYAPSVVEQSLIPVHLSDTSMMNRGYYVGIRVREMNLVRGIFRMTLGSYARCCRSRS